MSLRPRWLYISAHIRRVLEELLVLLIIPEEGWSGQPKYSNTFYIYSTLHRFHETESHFPLQQTD